MVCYSKKILWFYTLAIFGLFISLAEAASVVTASATIDAHIAAPIQAKAQQLFYRPAGELTAEQYARTLSSVIDDTERDAKLGPLMRSHYTHWLSGGYGFSTKIADTATMEAYASVVAKVRCVEGIDKAFEAFYPLEGHYRATHAPHFAFLRHVDTAMVSLLTNPTAPLITPWATTIRRAVDELRRETKGSPLVSTPGGPVSWMPHFSVALDSFARTFLSYKVPQDPLAPVIISSYDILFICNTVATTLGYNISSGSFFEHPLVAQLAAKGWKFPPEALLEMRRIIQDIFGDTVRTYATGLLNEGHTGLIPPVMQAFMKKILRKEPPHSNVNRDITGILEDEVKKATGLVGAVPALDFKSLDLVLLCVANVNALWEKPFTREEEIYFSDARGGGKMQPSLYGKMFVHHRYDTKGDLYLVLRMKNGFEYWVYMPANPSSAAATYFSENKTKQFTSELPSSPKEVKLYLRKNKFTQKHNLIKDLQAIGLGGVSKTSTFALSRPVTSTNPPLNPEVFEQTVQYEEDIKGAKAIIVTAFGACKATCCPPPDPMEVIYINKPYTFSIVKKVSDSLCLPVVSAYIGS